MTHPDQQYSDKLPEFRRLSDLTPDNIGDFLEDYGADCYWLNPGSLYDKLMALFQSELEGREKQAVEKNKSFCGCPMCLHHTEAYGLHQLSSKK